MKRWIIPVTIVALMIAGATAGAFASGGGDGGPAAESLPPVSSDDAATQPGCELGALECDDTPDTCEPVPLRSDCGIDPDVCNQVHNIDACTGSPVREPGDPAVQDASDLPTDDLGDGIDSACDPVPLRSDCGIDPNECNKVHNITACTGSAVSEPGDPVVLDADTLPVYDLGHGSDPNMCVETYDVISCGEVVNPPGPQSDFQGDTTGQYRVVVSYNTSVTQPDLDETAAFLRGFDAGLEFVVQESWPPTGVASLQTDTPNFCDAIFDELASQSYINDFSCGPQEILNDVNEDVPVVNPAP